MLKRKNNNDLDSVDFNISPQEEREKYGEEKPKAKDTARLIWASKPKKEPNAKELEFQTAEEVYPNISEKANKRLLSFVSEKREISEHPNRLIWGDNLLIMQALLAQGYEGQIDLIYIDPPFNTGENFNFSTNIKIGDETYDKELSISERLAYTDTWNRGMDSFFDMIYPRLKLMKRLLSEKGSIFVHIDWHAAHYVKTIMDEIFGRENFRNEIVVRRTAKHTAMQFEKIKTLQVANDSILVYSNSNSTIFNKPLREASERQKKGSWHGFSDNCYRPTQRYLLFGKMPPSEKGRWLWSKDRSYNAVENYKKFEELLKLGKCKSFEDYAAENTDMEFVRENNGSPQYWIIARDEIMCDSNWMDIQAYSQRYGYGTEKSEALMQRIIEMGSKEGDLVADFFCGSGPTLALSERLKRKWLGADLSKTSIQVSRSRLINEDTNPFLIQNLGNYQRQLIYAKEVNIKQMYNIILKLYGATPRNDWQGFGISKEDNRTLVFVCEPDRPMTGKKAFELAKQAKTSDGKGYKRLIILAWDYEYEFDDVFNRLSKNSKKELTNVEFKIIPSDVYKYLRSTKVGDQELANKITFYQKPYIKLSEPQIVSRNGSEIRVKIKIEQYVIMDIPVKDETKRPEIEKLLHKNFANLIDYWTIDWDYDGSIFRSKWQAIRTRKSSEPVPVVSDTILKKGKKYVIAVRVVDVFGNDASMTKEIDLR